MCAKILLRFDKMSCGLECQQPLPGLGAPAQPPTSIWVRRWEYAWAPTDRPCEGACQSWQKVATCTFVQAVRCLPAICDWPRWRTCVGDADLPPDEYFKLRWLPQYVCADPTQVSSCGLTLTYTPSWERIETPRAVRWVGPAGSGFPAPLPPLCPPPYGQ
jgi:hypothetical protein